GQEHDECPGRERRAPSIARSRAERSRGTGTKASDRTVQRTKSGAHSQEITGIAIAPARAMRLCGSSARNRRARQLIHLVQARRNGAVDDQHRRPFATDNFISWLRSLEAVCL